MFKSKIKTTIIGGVIVGAVVFAVSAFGVLILKRKIILMQKNQSLE